MSTASPVESGSLTCPACGAALGPHGLDAAQEGVCPACRAGLRGQVFPVWWTPVKSASTFERAMEGEAVCFFHPANRAVLPCDTCGRFLCSICDLPVGSRHLCPVCLSKGLGKEKLPEIIPRRFLWSRTALWLGAVPLILSIAIWPVLFISGGAAVIIALVGWSRPGSLVRGRQRWAAVLGVVLGLLQVGVWFGFIFLISYASRHSK
ncbi:MAG: hypothetical protein ABJF10_26035 [Chthoniobacter sp.]|uniref:hypothetical protein n=1 Tax=Chthoniobacter sp. TaxID=2510640 RepID=UPI0032A3AAF3